MLTQLVGCGSSEDLMFSHCITALASLFICSSWVLLAAKVLKGFQGPFSVSVHNETQANKGTYWDMWWQSPLTGASRLSYNSGEEGEHWADREGGLLYSCFSVAGFSNPFPW